jgi:hypothetical protein
MLICQQSKIIFLNRKKQTITTLHVVHAHFFPSHIYFFNENCPHTSFILILYSTFNKVQRIILVFNVEVLSLYNIFSYQNSNVFIYIIFVLVIL